MNKLQKITTPGGETMVVMSLGEYEALIDALDIAAADKVLADVAAGRDEFIPSAMVDRLLNKENPIRVWREYRGLSATALAQQAEISAAYLSELETGKKEGSVGALARIAAALRLTIDDLI